MKLDIELLKCSLVISIIFFVLSHPSLYRLLHKQLHKVMAFVDDRMCPTEGGVLVHAIIFGLIVYFGKKLYDKYNPKKKNPPKGNNLQQIANLQNQHNNIPKKCQMYCEKISNKIQNKMNNLTQKKVEPTFQNSQLLNNNPNNTFVNNQANNMMANNMMANNQANNMMANNQANNMMANNQANNNMMANNQANNNMMANNQANNNMMTNNQANNNMMANNQANNMMANNQDNNMLNHEALNQNMALNENQGSFNDIMVNTLAGGNNSNTNNLSCGTMPDFNNQLNSGNMFSENTTYVDDMYSSVNF